MGWLSLQLFVKRSGNHFALTLLLLFVLVVTSSAFAATRHTPISLRPDDVLPTGNQWISLPDIRAIDGSLNTFNVLSMHHRGLLQVRGENNDYGLDFGYHCEADTIVGQQVECTVDARRFGSQSWGMLTAEVGLPPGADVDRASLAKLLDNSVICRYELQPDRIVFYL